MSFQVRSGVNEDGEAILALMPRLAAFDVPNSRNPVDLWRSDAAMLQRWLDGKASECFVHVAVDDARKMLGFTLVSLRPELLSHEPSAHLEAIVVGEGAEGMGVGRALLAAAESEANSQGALTITLHVFASNTRARGFYEQSGYDGELLRYIKELAE
ncbi:putative GCN5-related N-acetyltransferase [uncultured Woeseiaceae bacterium]|uniref:Putative GCN5-related N-acetyltransferase n=1 Tax=uncultured Woeseiaceae bacterium TaxID=1983305 RepID=A0A7D9D1I5_9GAMM|nr:putative GCN5-related N-acetyltransferase [uncultured Woeseiaceae bacterium]